MRRQGRIEHRNIVHKVKYLPAEMLFLLVMIIVMLCFTLTACSGLPPEEQDAAPDETISMPEVVTRSVFALYNPQPVMISPSLEQPAVAPDLSNVYVPMPLSEAQRTRLAASGLVASPGLQEKEFFTLYEKARYDNVPVFITSDSLLHIYHLLFSKVLRTAEAEYFHPLLKELNSNLVVELDKNYTQLKGTSWEEAALHAVAFVSVSGILADPEFAVPPYCQSLVEAEVGLIEAAQGVLPSAVFPGLFPGEDYTQYIPRGHYTKSEELKAYFKSMMYYGRMTFRLSASDVKIAEDETRMALILIHALRNTSVSGAPALEAWADLYDPTAFLVGRSDDLTAHDYINIIDELYGVSPALEALADDSKLGLFMEEAKQLPPPLILGLALEDMEEMQRTKGMRFMGQRFVPDAYIFQQLTFDNVGSFEERRGLPTGLDLFAAVGSDRAYALLDEMGETAYDGYPEQMDTMRTWTESLSVGDWTETVYNAWIYNLFPLLEIVGEGYPDFMQSEAWVDKQLNTSLGSWAELKHDTILYAKQSYTELGGDWGPTAPDPLPARGYVEPVPEFYARLAALSAMTREGLVSRGLLDDRDNYSLLTVEDLALFLKDVAEKQLMAMPLTEDEFRRIRFYGGDLELLVIAASDPAEGEESAAILDEDPQAALVADVATDLNPSGLDFDGPAVLEVAVGRIDELHVIVPLVEADGSITLQVAKGGIFSYYEFPWPYDDRLTDEKWQEMLGLGTAPPRPAWIDGFYTAEGEYNDLLIALNSFHKGWVGALFYQDVAHVISEYYSLAEGDALRIIDAEVEALKAAGQFESRQLVGADYRSFDMQTPDLAVVTVRETWQDTLYRYEGYEHPAVSGVEEDMIEIGRRGPYSLDLTYTLEREAEHTWVVTRIVLSDERPAW